MTIRPYVTAALALLLATGCSPKYNWRDHVSRDGHYRVLFPARPSSVTRVVDLDGMRVAMTMTAADIEGATFAVGTAEAQDAAGAQAALAAMQTALVRNIRATVTSEKVAAASNDSDTRAARDVDASGTQKGEPMRLVGHFEARGKRFYQVVVLGKTKSMPAEQVEQFLSSFKIP
jgi:hypothetical protein